jgi:nucleotide-binding universal stress UspA family protein
MPRSASAAQSSAELSGWLRTRLASFRTCRSGTRSSPCLAASGHGIGTFDHSDSPEWHREQQARAMAALRERGIEAEVELGLGDAPDEILRVATEHDADLIIVGTREPNLLARLLGLSVSGAVQRKAHCERPNRPLTLWRRPR